MRGQICFLVGLSVLLQASPLAAEVKSEASDRIGNVRIVVAPDLSSIERETSALLTDPRESPSDCCRLSVPIADYDGGLEHLRLQATRFFLALQVAGEAKARALVLPIPESRTDLWLLVPDKMLALLGAIDQYTREGGGTVRRVVLVSDELEIDWLLRDTLLLKSYADRKIRRELGLHNDFIWRHQEIDSDQTLKKVVRLFVTHQNAAVDLVMSQLRADPQEGDFKVIEAFTAAGRTEFLREPAVLRSFKLDKKWRAVVDAEAFGELFEPDAAESAARFGDVRSERERKDRRTVTSEDVQHFRRLSDALIKIQRRVKATRP